MRISIEIESIEKLTSADISILEAIIASKGTDVVAEETEAEEAPEVEDKPKRTRRAKAAVKEEKPAEEEKPTQQAEEPAEEPVEEETQEVAEEEPAQPVSEEKVHDPAAHASLRQWIVAFGRENKCNPQIRELMLKMFKQDKLIDLKSYELAELRTELEKQR